MRQVTYWLFNLQNGTLSPLVGPSITPPPVKIEEWEANSSNPNVVYCTWQKPGTECETPDTAEGGLDGPGQITDNMGAASGSFTVQQQFLVDRQGVQVFWPTSGAYLVWGMGNSRLEPGWLSTQPDFEHNGHVGNDSANQR